jgi:hypothetical protein
MANHIKLVENICLKYLFVLLFYYGEFGDKMKINVYLSGNGAVYHVLKDSINENEYKIYYKLIHAYEIPKKECEHYYNFNNGKGVCNRCGNVAELKMTGTMNAYIEEPKPIINPHMKQKRPNYKEAEFILTRHNLFASYSTVDALRDLGFEPEGEK